jgi:hypothetical protein
MTYPPQGPQGPYGQQPDPYGQQQPDPYGQQQQPQYGGGYPQQPQQPTGQYGAYDPNAQYGGGYQQYGGVGGPPPPKSNKGPIIAIVSIVVLLLAGLGITGFVAPGFFLSDKTNSAGNNNGGDNSSTTDPTSGADAVITQLVAAADKKDKSALRNLTCSDAKDIVNSAIDAIDETDSTSLKDTKKDSSNSVIAMLTITVNGKDRGYAATIKKAGKDWCWADIVEGDGSSNPTASSSEDTTATSESTPGGSDGSSSDGAAFIQSFLDKIGANDATAVQGMLCSDATETAKATSADIATKQSELKLDNDAAVSTTSVSGNVSGTLNGQEASGVTSAFIENDNWCIYTFFVS